MMKAMRKLVALALALVLTLSLPLCAMANEIHSNSFRLPTVQRRPEPEVKEPAPTVEYQVDENGNQILDENGNPIPVVYMVDENGNLILDENGNPIPVKPVAEAPAEERVPVEEEKPAEEEAAAPAEGEAATEEETAAPAEGEVTTEEEAAPAEGEAATEEETAAPAEGEAITEEEAAAPVEGEAATEEEAAPAEGEAATEEAAELAAQSEVTEEAAEPAAQSEEVTEEAAEPVEPEVQPAAPAAEKAAPAAEAPVLAPDAPATIMDADVREAADSMSFIIETLPAETPITVLGIEGNWALITAGEVTGFVHRNAVRNVAFAEVDPTAPVEMDIIIYSSARVTMTEGDLVTLTTELIGFEDHTVIGYQWEVDRGNGFEIIAGANEDRYSFEASVETLAYDWAVTVEFE